LLRCAEVVAQAAEDKIKMRSEIDALTAEVGLLKEEQVKTMEMQRLHDERLAKVEE
jgi:hypothetical protein